MIPNSTQVKTCLSTSRTAQPVQPVRPIVDVPGPGVYRGLQQPPQRTVHPNNVPTCANNPNPDLQSLASELNAILQPMEEEVSFQADYNMPIRAGGSKKQCVPIGTVPLAGQPLTQSEINTWQQKANAGLTGSQAAVVQGFYSDKPSSLLAALNQSQATTACPTPEPVSMSWARTPNTPKARPDEMERLNNMRQTPCQTAMEKRQDLLRRREKLNREAVVNQKRSTGAALIAQAAIDEVRELDAADAVTQAQGDSICIG